MDRTYPSVFSNYNYIFKNNEKIIIIIIIIIITKNKKLPLPAGLHTHAEWPASSRCRPPTLLTFTPSHRRFTYFLSFFLFEVLLFLKK
jgi:hypothetical protein